VVIVDIIDDGAGGGGPLTLRGTSLRLRYRAIVLLRCQTSPKNSVYYSVLECIITR